MQIEVMRVRWLRIKPTRLRKITPAQNEPEWKMTQKDCPQMILRFYHIIIEKLGPRMTLRLYQIIIEKLYPLQKYFSAEFLFIH